MKIYISGKITGTSDFVGRFAAAEKKLKVLGYDVINPVKECLHIQAGSPWETYMRKCIQLLADADAIYLMKGWRRSRGACIEQRIAVDLNLAIIMEEDKNGI